MIHLILTTFSQAIGIHTLAFTTIIDMIIRAIILYFFGITLLRLNKKLMGIRTPLNFTIFVAVGSLLAQAIISAEHFFPIACTIITLLAINSGMNHLAFRYPWLERIIKGQPFLLVKNGHIRWHAMRENAITRTELLNELQTQMQTRDLNTIHSAILASDGTINFTKKKETTTA